jgi:hypothetical protein
LQSDTFVVSLVLFLYVAFVTDAVRLLFLKAVSAFVAIRVFAGSRASGRFPFPMGVLIFAREIRFGTFFLWYAGGERRVELTNISFSALAAGDGECIFDLGKVFNLCSHQCTIERNRIITIGNTNRHLFFESRELRTSAEALVVRYTLGSCRVVFTEVSWSTNTLFFAAVVHSSKDEIEELRILPFDKRVRLFLASRLFFGWTANHLGPDVTGESIICTFIGVAREVEVHCVFNLVEHSLPFRIKVEVFPSIHVAHHVLNLVHVETRTVNDLVSNCVLDNIGIFIAEFEVRLNEIEVHDVDFIYKIVELIKPERYEIVPSISVIDINSEREILFLDNFDKVEVSTLRTIVIVCTSLFKYARRVRIWSQTDVAFSANTTFIERLSSVAVVWFWEKFEGLASSKANIEFIHEHFVHATFNDWNRAIFAGNTNSGFRIVRKNESFNTHAARDAVFIIFIKTVWIFCVAAWRAHAARENHIFWTFWIRTLCFFYASRLKCLIGLNKSVETVTAVEANIEADLIGLPLVCFAGMETGESAFVKVLARKILRCISITWESTLVINSTSTNEIARTGTFVATPEIDTSCIVVNVAGVAAIFAFVPIDTAIFRLAPHQSFIVAETHKAANRVFANSVTRAKIVVERALVDVDTFIIVLLKSNLAKALVRAKSIFAKFSVIITRRGTIFALVRVETLHITMFVLFYLVTIQADTLVAAFGINTVRIAIAVVLNSTFVNINTSVIRHGVPRSTATLVASVCVCALVITTDTVITLIDVQAVDTRV